ncbi:MAG: putative manganese transporter [Bacteroidales bacterium]
MNLDIFIDTLRNSILITGLVLIMMLMIEYFNIQSHGKWFLKLQGSKLRQIILGSLFGLIPGCIGGFACVSLFTHNLISFGALIAMMISSSGDEAFIILAMIPQKALLLFGILFLISVTVGILIDYVFFKKPQKELCPDKFEIHTHTGHNDNNLSGPDNNIPSIFKASSYRAMLHPSKERIIILLGIALFISAVIFGILECGHHHQAEEVGHIHTQACAHQPGLGLNLLNERWINIIFAIISIITLFFTATAKEHFIKEHLWAHVIKKHLLSIFLWTFGTLLICQIGMQYLDINHWISNNMLVVVLLAIAIGIIPESGPHLVFITLYAQGILPFYVLLVNSIVQDGHTTLPLLAQSKSYFFKAKLVNVIVGLVVGILCWFFQII